MSAYVRKRDRGRLLRAKAGTLTPVEVVAQRILRRVYRNTREIATYAAD